MKQETIFSRNGLLKAATLLPVICCFISLFLSACSGSEPMIPADVAEKIQENLGYALAPTWMPEGFDYSGPYIHNIVFDQSYGDTEIVQGYSKIISLNETAQLVLSYPATEVNPPALGSVFEELVPPEEAVSEVEINGGTASLVTGTWSRETLLRIQRIETPLDPEWDYEGGYSIRFTINVPEQGGIAVRIFTVSPTDAISADDLVKIARSVAAVD
jgi:hypothetical protein